MFPDTWWDIQPWKKIQQAFHREPYGVYRNMKKCILEDNLKGKGW